MKVISERISILKKENVLSVVILPGIDRKRITVMFLWLFAWTVCGAIVFVNYFQTKNPDLKLFIIIYLSFWAYFEVNMVRAFMWKRSGKEKLWIQDDVMYYQREISGRGKIHEYDLNLIGKLELIELKATRLADTLGQSFWVKGGERLMFRAQSRTVMLGMQLTDEEARAVLKEVNPLIP